MSSDIKTLFAKRMSKATSCHEELILAVHNKRNERALQTMLVEQYVTLAVVTWETYLHDLFIAYILKKPDNALSSIEKRITQSVESKFGSGAANCLSFSVKTPLTEQRITSLIDPKEWNITVKSAQELTSKANDMLHATHAMKFSLDKADSQFLDFAIAMRNYLSHRSAGSRSVLKDALAKLSEPANQNFSASIQDLGSYLKHSLSSGKSRAVEFVQRLVGIANKL